MGTSIIETFTTALSSLGTGVAETVVNVFDKVFVGAEGGLSNLAIYGIVMGAVALGIGLVHKFTRKAG